VQTAFSRAVCRSAVRTRWDTYIWRKKRREKLHANDQHGKAGIQLKPLCMYCIIPCAVRYIPNDDTT